MRTPFPFGPHAELCLWRKVSAQFFAMRRYYSGVRIGFTVPTWVVSCVSGSADEMGILFARKCFDRVLKSLIDFIDILENERLLEDSCCHLIGENRMMSSVQWFSLQKHLQQWFGLWRWYKVGKSGVRRRLLCRWNAGLRKMAYKSFLLVVWRARVGIKLRKWGVVSQLVMRWENKK